MRAKGVRSRSAERLASGIDLDPRMTDPRVVAPGGLSDAAQFANRTTNAQGGSLNNQPALPTGVYAPAPQVAGVLETDNVPTLGKAKISGQQTWPVDDIPTLGPGKISNQGASANFDWDLIPGLSGGDKDSKIVATKKQLAGKADDHTHPYADKDHGSHGGITKAAADKRYAGNSQKVNSPNHHKHVVN